MRAPFRIPLFIIIAAVFVFVSMFALGEVFMRQKNRVVASPTPSDAFLGEALNQSRGLSPFEGARQEEITPSPVAVPTESFCAGADLTSFDCYEDYFSLLTKQEGSQTAFALLRSLYDTSPYIKSQCHPLSHVIGRASAEKYASVGDAFAAGDSFCWSGYHHGVMESVIAKIGKSKLPTEMDGICASLRDARRYSFDHYNCVHGLGHGVMAITQTELFESLTLCDNLQDMWERQSCWSGVFMENVIVDGTNHFTKYLKPTEPLYPCNAVGEEYKQTCYLMQTSYMLKVLNGDFKKVFALCANADEGHVETCYQSLGRDASGRSVSDIQQTKATCDLGSNFSQRSNCIIGAVKDFISYHHGDVEAKQLCASLSSDLQSVCISTAESYVKVL